MIDLHLNLFGVILDLSMIFPKRKKKVQKAEEVVPNEEKPNNTSEFLHDLEEDNIAPIKLSKIEEQALKFQNDLKNTNLYDIPDTSELPPRYQIQDDVEIITDSFEKEIEDIIEGRR